MLNHNQTITFKEKTYDLHFDKITTDLSITVDENSFINGSYNSFKEIQELLSRVHFILMRNNELIIDSKEKSINDIDFKLVKYIYDVIKPHLNLSSTESDDFRSKCADFLNKSSHMMPSELLIAQQMINNCLTISLSELENMDIKKFEKIQIAISEIKKHEINKKSEK